MIKRIHHDMIIMLMVIKMTITKQQIKNMIILKSTTLVQLPASMYECLRIPCMYRLFLYCMAIYRDHPVKY